MAGHPAPHSKFDKKEFRNSYESSVKIRWIACVTLRWDLEIVLRFSPKTWYDHSSFACQSAIESQLAGNPCLRSEI